MSEDIYKRYLAQKGNAAKRAFLSQCSLEDRQTIRRKTRNATILALIKLGTSIAILAIFLYLAGLI